VAGVTTSYTAAAELVRRVREFAQTQPVWAECILYETKPDEEYNIPLASQRIYGRRTEYLAVLAAAGLDTVEQALTPRSLVLPTDRQLAILKALAGFVDDPFLRTPEQTADPLRTR
jgi:hypothetical protein